MSKKRLLSRAEVDVDVWEERDRLSIVIRDKKTGQRTIAEWWDDDARQMFEDGFFKRGGELKRSVIAYAEEMGLLAKQGPGSMTLAQWAWNQPYQLQKSGKACSIPDGKLVNRSAAWHLSDYLVSSVSGGSIWFAPRSGARQNPSPKKLECCEKLGEGAACENCGKHTHFSVEWLLPSREGTDTRTACSSRCALVLKKKGPGPGVRKNIFLFNNPGNAQRILADNFVRGANSGVASSMYIHGNRIYSYGPHFPIAERHVVQSEPVAGTPVIIITNRKSPSKTTSGQIGLVKAAAQQAGMEIMYEELKPEAKGPAAYSNPGVRKNIFVFNNGPRKLNEMESAAAAVGLVIGTWAPGDGLTRYRFFLSDGKSSYGDYHQGDGLYTALGRKDAMAFISAYGKGRSARTNPPSKSVRAYKVPSGHEERVARMLRDAFIWAQARDGEVLTMARPDILKRAVEYVRKHGYPMKNPLTRSEAGYLLRHARADVREAGSARRHGLIGEQKYHTGRARGIGFAVQETGPKAGRRAWVAMHTTLDRVLRNPPVCANPIVRGDKLPYHLQQEILRKFIYRWTTGNTQRDSAWSGISGKPRIPLITDAQWLREHAFHVTKAGKLDLRHHHAEPGFMAKENPLTRAESASVLKHARKASHEAGWFRKHGPEAQARYWNGVHDEARRVVRDHGVRKNPLLQTIGLAMNPPVSDQWDRMTGRQRLMLLEFVGFEETAGRYVRLPWKMLSGMVKQALEQYWRDSSARGTTRRRPVPVGANPLTRTESGQILRDARFDVRHGSTFQGGHTRSSRAGMAFAKAKVVRQYGPKSARRAANRISDKARTVARTTISNPGGLRLPAPGTKMTVAQAMVLARQIGDRGLIRECQAAAKLQSKANSHAKTVTWKHLPMGSKDKIDSVVALTHYGDSPEDMYRPPKGSKKGTHMYRHKWGDGSGRSRPVPVLASPSGKMIVKVMGPGQKVGDWMRG